MDNKAPILTDDQARQIEFVKQVLGGIERQITTHIMNGKIPARWDGFELRRLIAEYAKEWNFVKMAVGRARDYINTRRVGGF